MKITWYGHSCFGMESADGSAVFDPYSPGSCPGISIPAGLTADACFCSHGHGDHNWAEGIALTGNTPGFGIKQLNTWHDDAGGAKRGPNVVTILEAEGLRVAHLGDLGHELDEEAIAALKGCDVLLIPIGGFFTIDGPTARRVADAVGARITVPMHYRGEGFGFGAISTVDAFLEGAGKVVFYEASAFDPAEFTEPFTLVLKAPLD